MSLIKMAQVLFGIIGYFNIDVFPFLNGVAMYWNKHNGFDSYPEHAQGQDKSCPTRLLLRIAHSVLSARSL
jgi:hypothetical protein